MHPRSLYIEKPIGIQHERRITIRLFRQQTHPPAGLNNHSIPPLLDTASRHNTIALRDAIASAKSAIPPNRPTPTRTASSAQWDIPAPTSGRSVPPGPILRDTELQEGFRRYLDTTPTARLREARLVGVHNALAAADPTKTTVATVAADWGFWHLGRFSALYRRR
ncbi:helix-turn-helix domain-containing protein [Nocardia gipuzkoensis]